jgi:hypothetical protein
MAMLPTLDPKLNNFPFKILVWQGLPCELPKLIETQLVCIQQEPPDNVLLKFNSNTPKKSAAHEK